MKMRNFSLMCVSVLLASCADNSGKQYWEDNNDTAVVMTRVAAFDGNGQTLEGENDVTDMQACLFEGGIMTKVYDNLQTSGDAYRLQVDSRAGNLYMLANAADAVDLNRLQGEGISEAEWLKHIYKAEDSGRTRPFFTGVLVLDASGQNGNAQILTLKRGVARFDVTMNVAGTVRLEKFTLTNVARSAYLFSQGEVKSPADAVRRDTTVTFPSALTKDTPGVLYVYEQENAGMEIKIEASFDGGEVKTLTKTLDAALRRNAVYTVTVSKDHIDIIVKPVFEEWESGGNIELTPSSHMLP